MDSLYYEEFDKSTDHEDIPYYESSKNQIFNHNFVYANTAGNFPAGWQKGRESKSAALSWEEDQNQKFSIKINNRSPNHLAAICQQRSYRVEVYEKQVWEVGAFFTAHHQFTATIKVNFVCHSSTRASYCYLNFLLHPGQDYYCSLLTVPADADYAYLELGTKDIATFWVSNIVFRRAFPVARLDADARGRLNINTVSSVKKIIDPVTVTGDFEFRRIVRDVTEEVVAGPELKASGIQDVLNMSTYSFCVVNQGEADAMARLELSPNGINWMYAAGNDDVVPAGQMKILVPDFFLRYIRLNYWTESSATTYLSIYFQGQG